VVSNLTGGCANTTLLRKVTLQGHTPLQKTFNSPPRGMGQTPLSELALRVQLSGVPPAYGSWLLTPQPPLHEGEKQPVGQKGSEKRAASQKINTRCKITAIACSFGHGYGLVQTQHPTAAFF